MPFPTDARLTRCFTIHDALPSSSQSPTIQSSQNVLVRHPLSLLRRPSSFVKDPINDLIIAHQSLTETSQDKSRKSISQILRAKGWDGWVQVRSCRQSLVLYCSPVKFELLSGILFAHFQ